MKPPPFETWISEDNLRSPRPPALAEPQPGFTARWQASLAARRAYQQRMQTRRTLLAFGSAIVLLFFVLIVRIAWSADPATWLVTLMNFTLVTLADLHNLWQAALTWLGAVPLSIPLAAWVLVTSGMVVLTAGWLFTLWRVAAQGVSNR